ncbi:putative ribonuclease H-like domain-containing protein [Tanacetum coccineum]
MSHNLLVLLSTFLEKHGYKRGTIDKTLFIRRNKKDIMLVQVYVDDIIFGSTNKSWCDEFEALMQSRFQMSSMGELTFFLGLQVKQNKGGIFISQDKYVAEILKKFDLVNVKAAITPMETKLPLTKDEEAFDVDVHLYRSMIGSLMYLTASRPDIMYAVCVCSRFQVTPKTSHLNAVKRIFKYLKGKPNLGLWYPRESPLDLEAFSDSDYGGSNLDRKSTTGGCQFLGQRLISWQCKKQTIVATSTTEAEYVAAANCCGQVLWVQNQLLDYGFNFMNTKIHIDNESTICIVKNPVYHSKTKHIEIRHHFIRDCYEKKLISVEKIHTDLNVADLLTKPFDGPRFNYLVVSIDLFEGWATRVSTDGTFTFWTKFLYTPRAILCPPSFALFKALKSGGLGINLVAILILKCFDLTRTCCSSSIPTILIITNRTSTTTYPYTSTSTTTYSNTNTTTYQNLTTPISPPTPPPYITTPPPETGPTTDVVHSMRCIFLSTLTFSPPTRLGSKSMPKDDLLQQFLNSRMKKPETLGRKSQDDPQDYLQYKDSFTSSYNKVASLKVLVHDQRKEYKRRKEPKVRQLVSSLDFQADDVVLTRQYAGEDKGQSEEEEELTEQQKKRKAQVQFEAQFYTNEDWDLIRAKLEANAELSKSMLGSELQGEDFAKRMVDLNQGTWKITQLKKLNFEEVKKEFDKLVKQIESFAPISFEATKASLKRFGEELQTKTPKRLKEEKDDEAKDDESTKKSGKRRKQMARKGIHTSVDENDSEDSDKVDKHKESNTGTETPINPVPVAMKTPSVATYKIIKQGEKGVYQIVREDGTDIVYINFGAMLKSISRDDLTELYRIVMNRYGVDGPEDKLEKGFWKCLRIMFEEPLSTYSIWSELGQQKIISWRYYDTCRVHCLNLESMEVYMLSERKYPLSAEFTMSNQHKDWLVQEQTALGKDFSNPFYGAKGLTSPEQTATGKGISNPLMAVMVCQKPYGIQLTNVSRVNTPGSDENRLKLYDLMYKIVKVADARDKVTYASSESEIGIDVIPTATKPPSIIDWKIIPQSGQKAVYQIIKRDGSDKIYMCFGAILR